MLTIILFIVIICLLLVGKKEDKFIDITNFKTNNDIFRGNFPNVIHKTFYEDTGNESKLSSGINDAIESWLINNPGYTIKLWDLNESREFLKHNFSPEVLKCFDSLNPYAFKSDFFRYCVIYKCGGWYSDLKQECLKYNLLNDIKKVKRQEYLFRDNAHVKFEDKNVDYCIQNAFFGAPKNSYLLFNMINKTIQNTKNELYGECVRCAAGSVCVFGKLFYELGYTDDYFIGYFDINLLPYFYDNNGNKLILHKCLKCGGNTIKNGNDYSTLWKNKDIYFKSNDIMDQMKHVLHYI